MIGVNERAIEDSRNIAMALRIGNGTQENVGKSVDGLSSSAVNLCSKKLKAEDEKCFNTVNDCDAVKNSIKNCKDVIVSPSAALKKFHSSRRKISKKASINIQSYKQYYLQDEDGDT